MCGVHTCVGVGVDESQRGEGESEIREWVYV